MSRSKSPEASHARRQTTAKLAVYMAVASISYLAATTHVFTPSMPQPPRGTSSRVGCRQRHIQAEQPRVVLRPDIGALRDSLAKQPRQATLEALERSWHAEPMVVDTVQLAGEWDLGSPGGGGVHGWLSGDLAQRIIRLYGGFLGRVFRMRLASKPVLRIFPTGTAETSVLLQWGFSRDLVSMASKIAVTGANQLRVAQVAVKSTNLRIKFPLPRKEHALRITYFDGGLLIIRDAAGAAEILWRRGGAAFAPVAGAAVASTPGARAGRGPAEVLPPAQGAGRDTAGTAASHDELGGARAESSSAPTITVSSSLREIQALRESLEAKRAQAREDLENRKRLEVDLQHVAASLDHANTETAAEEVALKISKTIEARTSESALSQRVRSEEEMRAFSKEEQSMADKQDFVASLRAELEVLGTREDAIRLHIRELKAAVRSSSRASRQAFRGATSKAQQELQEVGRSSRETARKLKAAERELEKMRRDVHRSRAKLEDEMTARQLVERQLEGQRRQFAELKVKHTEAVEHERAFASELATLQAELRAIEEKETEARELAKSMEDEAAQILAEAKEVKRIARGIQRPWRARFWPFR